MKKILILIIIVCFLSSCATSENSSSQKKCSREIVAPGIKNANELVDYFMFKNPDADQKQVERLAGYYITEANFEGINSDVAWIQMCHETGFLTFGGLVTPKMHNYCGLGSSGHKNHGCEFATEGLGVRAHIQHLHAYSTKDKKLKNKCIDPRYKYVSPRGKATDIYQLAKTWSTNSKYGNLLDKLLTELENF